MLICRSRSDSATTGIGEQVVPVLGRPGGQDERLGVDGAIGDQLVEVVGPHRGVLAHREVAEDQRKWFGVFADALAPGAVGVAAGEVGEHPGGFCEPHVSAAAGYGMSKCLCNMGCAYPDGAVEDD